MNFHAVLQNFGLKEKEAVVYLTSLKIGPASVYTLALKSGLKRPTTYVIVDELLKKGFLKIVRLYRHNHYQAIAPRNILKSWETNMDALRALVPAMEEMVRESRSRPQVEFFEGLEGIKKIYAEIEPDLYHGEEICWFGSCGEGFEENLPEQIIHWEKIAHDKRVHCREILDRTPANIRFKEKIEKWNLPYYRVRFSDKVSFFGSVDVALMADNVYIISLTRELFGIKIISGQIKKALQVIYEMAWQKAREE